MSREWKPGDIGLNLRWGYRGIFVIGCTIHERETCWHNESGHSDLGSDERRPLAVIDPESLADKQRVFTLRLREQMEAALRRSINDGEWLAIAMAFQAALREFANPTPRIEEPKGLGAVVADENGRLWVRGTTRSDDTSAWTSPADFDCADWADWDEINAVRVLSEGWSE